MQTIVVDESQHVENSLKEVIGEGIGERRNQIEGAGREIQDTQCRVQGVACLSKPSVVQPD